MTENKLRLKRPFWRVKNSEARQQATEAFQGVIRLVDAAQPPVCGPIFGVAVEIINMLNVSLSCEWGPQRWTDSYLKAVKDNKATAQGLVKVIGAYTERLEEFDRAMSMHHCAPDDSGANKAEQAVAAFSRSVWDSLVCVWHRGLTVLRRQDYIGGQDRARQTRLS